jgi:hypothetical protein
MWSKLDTIQLQADVFAFAIGLGSLVVSTYIALLLHRLSRKFSQNEAIRSINERWDAFHAAMLNKETHDLFWSFMRSEAPFSGLGDRAHHIVLMYLNNVHTEYYTYSKRIFMDYDPAYIDKLLVVFVPKREDVVMLARTSGYDQAFVCFLEDRLDCLSKQPHSRAAGAQPLRGPRSVAASNYQEI